MPQSSRHSLLDFLRERSRWLQRLLVLVALGGMAAVMLEPFWQRATEPGSPSVAETALPPADRVVLPVPGPALTPTERERALLGRRLFEDPGLSPAGMACASCHPLDQYATLPRARSPSLVPGSDERNIPTLFNVALNTRIGWDGKRLTLEQQLDRVLNNPRHMASSWAHVQDWVASKPEYRSAFERLYGGVIDRSTIGDAIVRFEQALLTPGSPFDRYLQGDSEALSADAREGFALFRAYGCVACHQGRNLGGNMKARFGVFGDPKAPDRLGSRGDSGRPGENLEVLRVPPLRNVARTGPYLDGGQVDDLHEVVRQMGRYQLGQKLPSRDVDRIVAFLESLTAPPPEILR